MNLWPIVALFGVGLAAVVAILVGTDPADAQARSAVLAILGILGPLLAGIWVSRRVEEVRREVVSGNGHSNGDESPGQGVSSGT